MTQEQVNRLDKKSRAERGCEKDGEENSGHIGGHGEKTAEGGTEDTAEVIAIAGSVFSAAKVVKV